jgi:hypothetical protein
MLPDQPIDWPNLSSHEQDPAKLLTVIEQINRLLENMRMRRQQGEIREANADGRSLSQGEFVDGSSC